MTDGRKTCSIDKLNKMAEQAGRRYGGLLKVRWYFEHLDAKTGEIISQDYTSEIRSKGGTPVSSTSQSVYYTPEERRRKNKKASSGVGPAVVRDSRV